MALWYFHCGWEEMSASGRGVGKPEEFDFRIFSYCLCRKKDDNIPYPKSKWPLGIGTSYLTNLYNTMQYCNLTSTSIHHPLYSTTAHQPGMGIRPALGRSLKRTSIYVQLQIAELQLLDANHCKSFKWLELDLGWTLLWSANPWEILKHFQISYFPLSLSRHFS